MSGASRPVGVFGNQVRRSNTNRGSRDMSLLLKTNWCHKLAILMVVATFGTSLSVAYAQPPEDGGEAAKEEAAPVGPTDQALNLNVMVEKYPKIKEIIETFREGDKEKTNAALDAFADEHDDLPPGGVIMALVFSAPNQGGAQQEALDSAVKRSPADPDAFLLLGQKAVSQRRLTEAGMLLDTAGPLVEKFSADADRKRSMQLRYNRDRAILNELNKDWSAASEHWVKLIGVEDSAGVRYRNARALFYMGTADDRKKALEEVTKAHEMDDKAVPAPYVAIAMLFDEIKNAEETKKWYEAAEKADPEDANMHLRFAHWQWKQGDAAEALRHAEAAAKLDDENLDPKFLLGLIQRYNNEPEKAQESFVECLKLRQDVPLIRNHLALVRLDIGDATSTTMARNMAVETFQKNQRDPFTVATLGYILFKSGDQKRGLQYLQAITRSPNLSPDARFFLASTLVDLGKTADAKKQLSQLLETPGLFAYRSQAERLLGGLE